MEASHHGADFSRRAGTAYLNQKHSEKFDLTNQTGSYMYMAPEVLMESRYNEQVRTTSCPPYHMRKRHSLSQPNASPALTSSI